MTQKEETMEENRVKAAFYLFLKYMPVPVRKILSYDSFLVEGAAIANQTFGVIYTFYMYSKSDKGLNYMIKKLEKLPSKIGKLEKKETFRNKIRFLIDLRPKGVVVIEYDIWNPRQIDTKSNFYDPNPGPKKPILWGNA